MVSLVCSFFVLIVSFKLFKIASGSMKLSKLNLISVYFYIELFISLCASTIILNKWINTYTLKYLLFDETKLYVWLSVLYIMIAMPLGMILTSKLFHINSSKTILEKYIEKPIIGLSNKKPNNELALYVILSLLSCISIIYMLSKLNHIPILEMFKGASPNYLALIRISAIREFSGVIQIPIIFGRILGQMLTYIAYIQWKKTRKKSILIWFIILFIFTSIMLTVYLEKALILWFLGGFLIINIMLNKLKTKTYILYSFVLIFIILKLFQFSKGFNNIKETISPFIERVAITQIEGAYLMYEIFPLSHEHIKGRSISNLLSKLLKFDYMEPAERTVLFAVYPQVIREGRIGTMTTLFIGDAWANFGFLGLILSPWISGAILQLFYVIILKSKKSPVNLAIYTYVTMNNPLRSGFVNGILFDSGLISAVMILLIIKLIAKINRDSFF